MFTDIITYEDFNGEEQTQELFFNISKMQALELQTEYSEGFTEYLEKISAEEDMSKMLDVFKKIVKMAYGVKSEDGKRFVKSEEVFKEFEESPAYDEFMMKLLTEEDYALNFILGALPNADGLSKEALIADVRRRLDGQASA